MSESSTSGPIGAHDTPPELAEHLVRSLAEHTSGPLRLLDPAAGTGALLAAAWRVLGPTGRLAPESLFGIERDAPRLAEARRRLGRELGAEVGGRVAANLVLGDALASEVEWPADTHVLANPPWASLSGRQALDLPENERADLTARFAACGGWPSLHGAFLERIAQHVGAPGTEARVLLPASLAELERYAAARCATTRHARLVGPPLALDDAAFAGVVEPAMLLALHGRHGAAADGDAAPWPLAREGADPLVAALASFPRLAPDCFRDFGVHSGNAAHQLIVRGDEAAHFPGLREGRDLAAFELGAPRVGLRTDLEATPDVRFRFAPLERYASVPVLVRQTADRPIAALHDAPTYFRNTLLACTPPPCLSPAFVVAVLNSGVLARYHRARFADARQRAFPQVKIGHLRALPFPLASRSGNSGLHDAIAAARNERLDALVTEAFGLSAAEARVRS